MGPNRNPQQENSGVREYPFNMKGGREGGGVMGFFLLGGGLFSKFDGE